MSARRRAILLGNAAYPADDRLPDLACPLNDVEGLAAVLADPAIGGFDPVETLRDASSGEARRRLVAFLREARPEDTVLFYYSGHGKLDSSLSQLHLCTCDSEVDLLEATGVSMRFVHDLLKKCRAQKSVVMLDCCYSGAAKGVRARGNIDEELRFSVQGTGTYLLTASNGIETAQEKEGGRYGIFTKHVIEGLRSGEADHDGRGYVTMDDLYDYVVQAVRADSPQRPNREVDGHGDIIIAGSGKDSRKDRAKAAAKLLFDRAAAGDVDPDIATAVVAVARKRPSDHSVQEVAIDSALEELLAERITLGAFTTAYFRAQSLAARPAAAESRGQPAPEPGPDCPPLPPRMPPRQGEAPDPVPSTPHPAPLVSTGPRSSESQPSASGAARIARRIGSAVLGVLGLLILANGLTAGAAGGILIGAVLLGLAARLWPKG
jgi:uncharacterized caspase-like protein